MQKLLTVLNWRAKLLEMANHVATRHKAPPAERMWVANVEHATIKWYAVREWPGYLEPRTAHKKVVRGKSPPPKKARVSTHDPGLAENSSTKSRETVRRLLSETLSKCDSSCNVLEALTDADGR